MKRFALIVPLLAGVFLFALARPLAAQEDDEIVIELQGAAAEPRPTPMLWDYNALQLTRQWRGKTREQLLYTMPVVSDRDGIVRGEHAEYMLVEYFSGGKFRKFLFAAESPQTFITVAATPADVLAVNKKYKVNIGLWLSDFEAAYASRAQLQQEDVLSKDTVLYQLSYTDVNTPKAQPNWFLFENKKLTKTFYTRSQKDAYLQQLKEQLKAAQQKAAAQKAAAEQAAATAQAQAAQAAQKNKPFKALLYGGTLHDQMYMPRVISPSSTTVLNTLLGK